MRTPESGKIVSFIVPEGTDVQRKQPLIVLDTAGVHDVCMGIIFNWH